MRILVSSFLPAHDQIVT